MEKNPADDPATRLTHQLIEELCRYDTSQWITYLWIHSAQACRVSVAKLESLQKSFHGDCLEIIKTVSGGMLIVLKATGDLSSEERDVQWCAFKTMITQCFGKTLY